MSTEPIGERTPPQFTLRSLFVVTAVVALVLGITLPLIRESHDAARAAYCQNNLKQIGLALHEYHDSRKAFPPAHTCRQGQRLHSWRTLVLPSYCMSRLYRQVRFDEPWDSPGNGRVCSTRMPMFTCPGDDASQQTNLTNYLAVVGSGTAWPGSTTTCLSDFRNGTSNSILAVEMADSDVPWMEPRDLEFDKIDFTINGPIRPGISSKHAHGANILFADGSVRCFPVTTYPEDLRTMFLIRGGMPAIPGKIEH